MEAIKNIKISPVNMEERKKIGIRAGDTVKVWQKIQEKGKTRLQAFEGLVLARKHGSEPGATFTVRRVSGGIGVEKIFPLYSPMVDRIEVLRRSKVRRSKLYYIREKVAREIKKQMRNMRLVNLSTTSDLEEQAEAEESLKLSGEAEKEVENQNADTPVVEENKDEDKAGNGEVETPQETTEENK